MSPVMSLMLYVTQARLKALKQNSLGFEP